MSDSGQFDRVYSEDESVTNISARRYHEMAQRKRLIILIMSTILMMSSFCSFYESIHALNTPESPCLTERDYFGKYLSSFLVELSSAIIGIVSSITTLLTIFLPLISGPEIMDQPKIASLISIVTLGQGSKSPMKTWLLFTVQLIGIASCFASLMAMTTCILKLLPSLSQEILMNIPENLGPNANILCLIHVLLRLTLCIISVTSIITILISLTRYMKLKTKHLNYAFNGHIKSRRISYSSKIVPVFSSILIIFGGFSVLSCLMGSLALPKYFRPDLNLTEKEHQFVLLAYEITNWLSTLPTGIFAIISGIFSVISVNCCSIPLSQIDTSNEAINSSLRVKNKNFLHIFHYLIAIIACIFTQVFSYQGYIMENHQIITKVKFIQQDILPNGNATDVEAMLVFHEILQIFYVKVGLSAFSNLFIMIFALPLLSMIILEMYIRMSFLKEIKIDSVIPLTRFNDQNDQPTTTGFYDRTNLESTIDCPIADSENKEKADLFLPTGLNSIIDPREDSIQFTNNNFQLANQRQSYPYNAFNAYNQVDGSIVYSPRHSISQQEGNFIMEEMQRAFQNNSNFSNSASFNQHF